MWLVALHSLTFLACLFLVNEVIELSNVGSHGHMFFLGTTLKCPPIFLCFFRNCIDPWRAVKCSNYKYLTDCHVIDIKWKCLTGKWRKKYLRCIHLNSFTCFMFTQSSLTLSSWQVFNNIFLCRWMFLCILIYFSLAYTSIQKIKVLAPYQMCWSKKQ
jgi:hypothetical protein